MNNCLIVDVHTHPYESKEIGHKNLAGNGQFDLCGTVEELSKIMKEAGIDIAILLSVIADPYLTGKTSMSSTSQEQGRDPSYLELSNHIKHRNEWVCSNARTNEQFCAFIYLDPALGPEEMVDEITDKVEYYGAKGIKISPGLGRYFPNDQSLYPVYETALKFDIPVLSHGGLFLADKEYTAPRNFVKIFQDFPTLKFVIAHLGRIYYDEVLDISVRYSNVYFDTSSAIPDDADGKILDKAEKFLGPLLSDDEAVRLIRKIGTDRVMFGSDYPWFNPANDIKRIISLRMSESEKEKILGLNARNLLSL